MSVLHGVFGVVGAVTALYIGVCILATLVDVIGRWRRNDWSV